MKCISTREGGIDNWLIKAQTQRCVVKTLLSSYSECGEKNKTYKSHGVILENEIKDQTCLIQIGKLDPFLASNIDLTAGCFKQEKQDTKTKTDNICGDHFWSRKEPAGRSRPFAWRPSTGWAEGLTCSALGRAASRNYLSCVAFIIIPLNTVLVQWMHIAQLCTSSGRLCPCLEKCLILSLHELGEKEGKLRFLCFKHV